MVVMQVRARLPGDLVAKANQAASRLNHSWAHDSAQAYGSSMATNSFSLRAASVQAFMARVLSSASW